MDTRESMFYFAHNLKLEVSLTHGADRRALADAVHQIVRYHGFRNGFRPTDADGEVDFDQPGEVDGRADNETDAGESADLTIAIQVGAVSETLAEEAEVFRTHPTGIRMLRTAECLYLTRDATVMKVQADSGHASILIPHGAAEYAADVNSTLYLFLTFGLVLLLQTRNLFVLHAAALVSPDDLGFLIVAPSGSGKSTLSLRLVEAGWSFVSDDSVVVGRAEEHVVVRPFRRDAAVFSDAVSEFPRAARFSRTLFSDPSKVLVDMSRAYPDQRLESMTPDVIVFPMISGQPESSIARMETAEAMVALIEQGSFLTADRTFVSRQMSILNELINGAELLNLQAGLDLRDDPEAAAELLALVAIDQTHPPSAT